jgi:transposase
VHPRKGASMGLLEIAKQVFQVHGADKADQTVLSRRLRRNEVTRFFSEQPLCLVGIKAGAHYRARVRGARHTVRLIVAAAVRQAIQEDADDAEGICEPVMRPNMRVVPQKSLDQ